MIQQREHDRRSYLQTPVVQFHHRCGRVMCAACPSPQALAGQELHARDREARETLALLDPSLQSALDDNTEVNTCVENNWSSVTEHSLKN